MASVSGTPWRTLRGRHCDVGLPVTATDPSRSLVEHHWVRTSEESLRSKDGAHGCNLLDSNVEWKMLPLAMRMVAAVGNVNRCCRWQWEALLPLAL